MEDGKKPKFWLSRVAFSLPPASVLLSAKFMKTAAFFFCAFASLAWGTTIDYPRDGSVFPPEIGAPTFIWQDSTAVSEWRIDVEFGDGSPAVHARSKERNWTPNAALWASIKTRSTGSPATVTITGGGGDPGRVRIETSRDPVGAPIFYRDVPLVPSATEKGVIKPLPSALIPTIGWRLRYLDEPNGRLVLTGLHSCANCHSFSRDGKTLGMDVDGPVNDKGTYALAPVSPRMAIRDQEIMTWSSFPDRPPGRSTIGFMSQISPDGKYAVSTVNEELYNKNFQDFRFLQVFYPTRGILAWFNRATEELKSLPGADDPRYVQTNSVWTPDGEHLVFARAEARSAYLPGHPPAAHAGDPNEVPIQYDLYRIPFNAGSGGKPEPIAGASRNGMSNSFPKVSPDGRWIVYVQARNGQLMRPDSQLYIVPSQGGKARRMRCNTTLMNSWHSFSPNGRWLVFSSKSRSPYTQLFLTHIDEEGNDTPAILIENSTAPDRAANIPEFVDIPKGGLLRIDVPAAEFYHVFDSAQELENQGSHEAAVAEWRKALALDPQNPKARTNLGISLLGAGAREEALAELRKAVELKPGYAEAHNNLAVALVQMGRPAEAIPHFLKYLETYPNSAEVRANLAEALFQQGRIKEALQMTRQALRLATEQKNLPLAETLAAGVKILQSSAQ